MRIALVAMPWPQFDSPSTALGSLSAVVRRDRPEYRVDCKYAYLDMWQRIESVYELISNLPQAEQIYVPLLYPEQSDAVAAAFADMADHGRKRGVAAIRDSEALLEQVLAAAEQNVEATCSQLVGQYDVVGFTLTFCQLFSSLSVARRLKERDDRVTVVFGGAGVEADCGSSVLAEYDCVDVVVQGEGERPFLRLLDDIASGDTENLASPGVLVRPQPVADAIGPSYAPEGPMPATVLQTLANQVADLDSLPHPDYGEYRELANALNIYWHLPCETSRGCWWNRALVTGNPRRACYFCNLNLGSYREKSAARVADEIRDQTGRYGNVRLRFMDNVMRRKGLDEMLTAIEANEQDLRAITEVRAAIRPYELLRLLECGCHTVQIGVEGLSTAYLRRIGKGATTIQNLQAMKTCFELGLKSDSNLLTHFPGTPQQEVDEMIHNVLTYAIAYHPANQSRFALYLNTAVHAQAERFGVENMRTTSQLASVLPKEVAERLKMSWLDFDCEQSANWSGLSQAMNKWKSIHEQLQKKSTFTGLPLFYTDGGSFLEIVDRRDGFRLITLEDEWRAMYLTCMEIRKLTDVIERLADLCAAKKVEEMLRAFVSERLMFRERGKCLSLACAVTPQAAARRIRKARLASNQKTASKM